MRLQFAVLAAGGTSAARRCAAAMCASLLLAVARPALAQESYAIRGSVRDLAGVPIEGVQIILSGTGLHAESGEDGRFTFGKVLANGAQLLVRRIGFRPDSIAVGTPSGGEATVVLVLERIAIALRPMLVSSRRVFDGPMAGFHRRRESGSGRFFTASEIEQRNPARLSDLFRMVPGLRTSARGTSQNSMRIRGSRCGPVFWLDGQPLNNVVEFDYDAFDPHSFEGIEIYSGPASVPVEFQRDRFGSSSCGTVLLWSKRGDLRPRREKRSVSSAATRVATLVEERQVFTDRDVDVAARVDSIQLVRPVYPDSLFTAGIRGSVLAEFVVNAVGEVQIETFNVVTATHRAFVESVREALREQRYIPARRQGAAVAQVVQQPFEFVRENASARRSPDR